MNKACACAAGMALGLLAGAPPALADSPTEELKRTTEKVLAVLGDPALRGPAMAAERERRLRRLADRRFAWPEMARRAMGRYWRKLTPAQRREFVELFSELIRKTYLDDLQHQTPDTIRYTGEVVRGDFGVVKMTVRGPKGVDTPLLFRVFKRTARRRKGPATRPASRAADEWLIYDISAEGISLVNNYRTQIRGIMARSSYQELARRLRERIAGMHPSAPAPASRPAKKKTTTADP